MYDKHDKRPWCNKVFKFYTDYPPPPSPQKRLRNLLKMFVLEYKNNNVITLSGLD